MDKDKSPETKNGYRIYEIIAPNDPVWNQASKILLSYHKNQCKKWI
jgi:hypothetical protein